MMGTDQKRINGLNYKLYDRTRRFYEKKGFVRIVLMRPYLKWSEPALSYAKCLKKSL